jgi:hypothetical protein
MPHPLTPDLSKMPIDELTNKCNDLIKRMTTAYRWGNPDMIGQLQLLIQDYQEELANRNHRALEEMESKSKNFKNIIDIQ